MTRHISQAPLTFYTRTTYNCVDEVCARTCTQYTSITETGFRVSMTILSLNVVPPVKFPTAINIQMFCVIITRNGTSVQQMTTGCKTGIRFPAGARISAFASRSRPTLKSAQPLSKKTRRASIA
jgi:hypothetical protein